MLICDPPSGWRYGFPRPVPDNYSEMSTEDFNIWLVSVGYPLEIIEDFKGRVPCRFWEHNDG